MMNRTNTTSDETYSALDGGELDGKMLFNSIFELLFNYSFFLFKKIIFVEENINWCVLFLRVLAIVLLLAIIIAAGLGAINKKLFILSAILSIGLIVVIVCSFYNFSCVTRFVQRYNLTGRRVMSYTKLSNMENSDLSGVSPFHHKNVNAAVNFSWNTKCFIQACQLCNAYFFCLDNNINKTFNFVNSAHTIFLI